MNKLFLTLIIALGFTPDAAFGQKTQPKIAEPQKPLGLEQLLEKSTDPLVRETAAQVLGIRGGFRALPLLTRSLSKDENLWVRARSAESLGLLGDPNAISPLKTALAKEKDQRVRRMIGQALLRLGDKTGLDELMWQLKAGTNHSRAEAMTFLVSLTGQPLGQNLHSWWTYLDAHGYQYLQQRRPKGAPTITELSGLPNPSSRSLQGPYLSTPRYSAWLQIPTIVLDIPERKNAITEQLLLETEKQSGPVPDGVFILIFTGGKPRSSPASPKTPQPQKGAAKKSDEPVPPLGPGLDVSATRFFLQRAPKLLGVGIDLPSIDLPGCSAQTSARDLLIKNGRMAIESIGNLDALVANGTRLLVVDQGQTHTKDKYRVKVFGVMP